MVQPNMLQISWTPFALYSIFFMLLRAQVLFSSMCIIVVLYVVLYATPTPGTHPDDYLWRRRVVAHGGTSLHIFFVAQC